MGMLMLIKNRIYEILLTKLDVLRRLLQVIVISLENKA